MLTGEQIRKEIEASRIQISPFNLKNVGPNSYDVTLAPVLLQILDESLDLKHAYRTIEHEIPSEGFVLEPGVPYLGVTRESTFSPCHIPMYDGRSTTGRYFLFSHVTAGRGDIGYSGTWTLEMVVVRPLRVYAGMRVGQIYFYEPIGITKQYEGHYGNANGAKPYPAVGVPGNI